MKTPLDRIRTGAILLATVSLVAVVGYRFVTGKTWIESVYWFVITVSSVGYAEQSSASPATQLFSIAVILVGMSAAFYTIGGFFQLLAEGEIERALGVRRMTREIKHLKDHVIICGYGRMGQILARELSLRGQPLLVVELNTKSVADAEADRFLVIHGNATEENVLIDAGVARARSLVSVLTSDADNLYITLTARNLSPNLQIIARGEQTTSEKKLIQAGADRAVLPMVFGAQRIARMITRPHTADLIEQVTSSEGLDVELDELHLDASGPLVGKTVREAEAHRTHRLLVVAVARSGGEMIFNPGADHMFKAHDTVMVVGHTDDIMRFRKLFSI